MTHFFQSTKPVYDRIGPTNHQIIKFKAKPKKGDEIVWQHVHDSEVEQKKTIIKDIIQESPGLMKNYFLVTHEIEKV